MKKNKLLTLILVLIMILSTVGCSQQAPAGEEEAEKLVIGVTMQGLTAPYVVSVKTYVEEALKAADVEYVILDGEGLAEKQIAQVENFISQGVDAIILNPIAFDGCAPAIEAANKAGIPIITLITRVANQDLADAWVGSEHFDSGVIEAQMLIEDLGGKGNIVVIEGVMGIDAQIQRMEGYLQELAKYPEIKIVAQQSASWQRDEALGLVENWLQSDKQFDAVLSQNDNMSMGALAAIEDAGLQDKIKVYGIDGDNDALQAVKDGRLAGTVFQDAKGQADKAVEFAIKLANGETVDKETAIPFVGVRPANVDDFLK